MTRLTQNSIDLLKKLYVILGFIPMLWDVNMVIIFAMAKKQLRHIPVHNTDPAPSMLSLSIFGHIDYILLFPTILSIAIFPFMLLYIVAHRKYIKGISFLPVIFFLIGVAIFLYLRFSYPAQFKWLMD